MPREGYANISIPQALNDRLFDYYNDNKKALKLANIRSFASYITTLLSTASPEVHTK